MLIAFVLLVGGEGGIRTHAPLNTETAFRERHHEPLGHLSFGYSYYIIFSSALALASHLLATAKNGNPLSKREKLCYNYLVFMDIYLV